MITATAFFAAFFEGATKTTPKASAGSSIGSILFIVILFGLAYVFFLRPRSQAARRQRDTLMELSAGDEVITGAGIYGTVLDVEPDRVTLETAPGTRITVVRSTIARRLTDHDTNSVAEQNWHDEAHDGVAEAAGWHDPSEHDNPADHSSPSGHDSPGNDHDDAAGSAIAEPNPGVSEKPEAGDSPGAAQGGGR